jgi:hypothetical protein
VCSFACFFIFNLSYFHNFEHYTSNIKYGIQGNKLHNKIFHNIVRSVVKTYFNGVSMAAYRFNVNMEAKYGAKKRLRWKLHLGLK